MKIIPEWLRSQKSQDGFLTHVLDKKDLEESEESVVEDKDTEDEVEDENTKSDVINRYGKSLKSKKK